MVNYGTNYRECLWLFVAISPEAAMKTNAPIEGNSQPEKRILRQLFRSKEGGLTAKSDSVGVGRLLENLLIHELQSLAVERGEVTLRFGRGYVVEDYGNGKYDGASASNADQVDIGTSPRFDIVCYRGDVAWRTFDGLPHALVPASFTEGVIEAKRTLFPKHMRAGLSSSLRTQLRTQRQHLTEVGVDGSHILVGAHFNRNSADEVREKALADHVALLGDLAERTKENIRRDDVSVAEEMACKGELKDVADLFLET